MEPQNSEKQHTNRLIHEKSLYLLQHAHNPVDWYPWCREALKRAEKENKMIFISIGFATCHWCHVMMRESFEDPGIAEFLNNHFINIKVDREERPDLDRIYMDALQVIRSTCGWPLNMFLTPKGKPINGGTYFPKESRYGRNSFQSILEYMVTDWKKKPKELLTMADRITSYMEKKSKVELKGNVSISPKCEEMTFKAYRENFDSKYGGFLFQKNNKFPLSMGLQFLLQYYEHTEEQDALEMVETTLRNMLAGGIYDQIAGGISRYSTDPTWLRPHFEKMLYDNALLASTLIETWQITEEPLYKQAAIDILTYLERDLLSPEGAFYSAEDAESEGKEGKYYLWNHDDIYRVLGKSLGNIACQFWGVTDQGNYNQDQSVLHQIMAIDELAQINHCSVNAMLKKLKIARQELWKERFNRVRPLRDDMVLVSWNAMAISAFAKAARVFGNDHYAQIALNAAEFIFSKMVNEDGRLMRRYRAGNSGVQGFLNDYTQLANASLDLYETTFDIVWFQRAQSLMRKVNELFYHEKGPYYDTGSDTEPLFFRSSEGADTDRPSGNSMAALVSLRLNAYGCGKEHFENACRIIKSFHAHLEEIGVNFAYMLRGFHWMQYSARKVVILGNRGEIETEKMLEVIQRGVNTNTVTAFVDRKAPKTATKLIPITAKCKTVKNKTIAYVFDHNGDSVPVHNAKTLREKLSESPLV